MGGYIKFKSEPGNAQIYVEDVYKGLTPADGAITMVTAPSYEDLGRETKFCLKKVGYSDYCSTINVRDPPMNPSYISAILYPAIEKAKACVNIQSPSGNVTKDVGSVVYLDFNIKNCGGAEGNFYYYIMVDEKECDSRVNYPIEAGASSVLLACNFIMPNSKVCVDFIGGHAESGEWVVDFMKSIIVNPKYVPPPPPAKGIITVYPSNFSKKEGENYSVYVCMQNIGDGAGMFNFRLLDMKMKTPTVINNSEWFACSSGASACRYLKGKMPHYTLNCTLELRRQT